MGLSPHQARRGLRYRSLMKKIGSSSAICISMRAKLIGARLLL